MNYPKLTLERASACRRDLVVSVLSSIFLTGGVAGGLALVSLHVSHSLEVLGSEPMVVRQAEAETEPAEVAEDLIFAASPAVSAAPSTVMIPTINALTVAARVAVPDAPVPLMDDLAWSEEFFQPWKEEKKPEVKKKRAPRLVVAQKISNPTKVRPVSARVVSRSSPSYPSRARRAGKEGRVVVTVTIATSGKVAKAYVSTSSRHSSLDSAALRAARKYRFTPAKNSRGQVISTKVSLPFSFKLT